MIHNKNQSVSLNKQTHIYTWQYPVPQSCKIIIENKTKAQQNSKTLLK